MRQTETFFLFSHNIPSSNLGFIDPKATELSLTLAGRDFTIHQSPTVLSSTRAGGTTGAGQYFYISPPLPIHPSHGSESSITDLFISQHHLV